MVMCVTNQKEVNFHFPKHSLVHQHTQICEDNWILILPSCIVQLIHVDVGMTLVINGSLIGMTLIDWIHIVVIIFKREPLP